MFPFKKSEGALLPLAQEDLDEEQSFERTTMLNHEYQDRKPQSRLQRLCSSNIPWIFTTVAALIYIFVFNPPTQKNLTPWSPTDAGEF
jgi:hypothetical protein